MACKNTLDVEDPPSPTDGEIDLEVLGRQRPAVFGTALREVMFCSSLVISMLMAVCSYDAVVVWLCMRSFC